MARKKSKSTKLLITLLVILIVVVCVCAFFIVSDLMKYKKGEQLYEAISFEYVLDDGADENSEQDNNSDTTDSIIIPPQINHAGLLAENEDYIGWLRVDACGIDLPVVQGESDDEYLHLGFDRQYIYMGTLFIEYKNHPDLSDPNTVLYGHNMLNTTMFSKLNEYLDEDFAKKNGTFWLSTEKYSYLYRIYSISVVRVESDTYTIFPDFGDLYDEYLEYRLTDSKIDMGVIPDSEARTLTLSTCYGPGKNGNRMIVQAYREGAYPAEGCTAEQAIQNELALRETEDAARQAELEAEAAESQAAQEAEEAGQTE